MRETKPLNQINKGCDLPPEPKGKKGIIMNTKKNGYVVNHADMEIVLTKAYSIRSSQPGSREFRELSLLHKAYPEYTIRLRTATQKEDKKSYAGLTLEQMLRYIEAQDNKVAVMASYDNLVALYGRKVMDKENPGKTVVRAPYAKVKSWFLKEFPNYGKEDFTTKNNAQPADIQQ